mmetsp:Transcript_7637/g.21385  ORF Transcript_7637/g.21385 Transcript_7637/m.21385 type:complete len:446 (-) Transcript_7637:1373-2710(-)
MRGLCRLWLWLGVDCDRRHRLQDAGPLWPAAPFLVFATPLLLASGPPGFPIRVAGRAVVCPAQLAVGPEREGRAGPVAARHGVAGVRADARAEGAPGAHPAGLPGGVVPVGEVPRQQLEGGRGRDAWLHRQLLETLEDPLRLAVLVPGDRGGEREVQLRDVPAGTRARVLQLAGDLHAGVGGGGLGAGVPNLRAPVREEPEAERERHGAPLGVVPAVADERFFREGSVLFGINLVAEVDACTLVCDGTLCGVALRECEWKTPRSLVALVVQCHGNASTILLPRQPCHYQSSHHVVPRAGDHRARCVDHNDDLFAQVCVVADQLDIVFADLQGGAVLAFGRPNCHDDDDDVGTTGLRVAAWRVVAAVRTRDHVIAEHACDTVLHIQFRDIVTGKAVPTAAATGRKWLLRAGLRAYERHSGFLRERQDGPGVLEHHGGLGDDAVGEL